MKNLPILLKNGTEVPHDYPFAADLLRQEGRTEQVKKTVVIEERRVTFIQDGDVLRDKFTKLYNHKQLLELSPEACKILIYIGVMIGYKEVRIRLTPELVGLSKRIFYRGILEMIGCHILRKQEQKKEWYWVNVTVLVYGSMTT